MEATLVPVLLAPMRFRDQRGWFSETYNERQLAAYGIAHPFVQDNHAYSTRCGTIRALHFQIPPNAQAKLVWVIRGRILDVAVDLRHGSPTYGRFVSTELSAANGHQVYIPIGFAHGYCTLEENVEVLYKVSEFYAPTHERGIFWNDPAIGIAWPVTPEQACLSDKDAALPLLRDVQSPFEYDGTPLRRL